MNSFSEVDIAFVLGDEKRKSVAVQFSSSAWVCAGVFTVRVEMSVGLDDVVVGWCAIVCEIGGAFGETEEVINGDDGNATITGMFVG